jgi:hypothetical protein
VDITFLKSIMSTKLLRRPMALLGYQVRDLGRGDACMGAVITKNE